MRQRSTGRCRVAAQSQPRGAAPALSPHLAAGSGSLGSAQFCLTGLQLGTAARRQGSAALLQPSGPSEPVPPQHQVQGGPTFPGHPGGCGGGRVRQAGHHAGEDGGDAGLQRGCQGELYPCPISSRSRAPEDHPMSTAGLPLPWPRPHGKCGLLRNPSVPRPRWQRSHCRLAHQCSGCPHRHALQWHIPESTGQQPPRRH